MSEGNDSSTWRQVNLWFDDWKAAEHAAATQLGPILTTPGSPVADWWFVRKAQSWRLRFRTVDEQTATALMKQLRAVEGVRRCVDVVYEPEVHAFGGSAAMDIAHELFHADSHHVQPPRPHAGWS